SHKQYSICQQLIMLICSFTVTNDMMIISRFMMNKRNLNSNDELSAVNERSTCNPIMRSKIIRNDRLLNPSKPWFLLVYQSRPLWKLFSLSKLLLIALYFCLGKFYKYNPRRK